MSGTKPNVGANEPQGRTGGHDGRVIDGAVNVVVTNPGGGCLRIRDHRRVRLVTWDRPATLNALNQPAYDATADALVSAAIDPNIAVVVITGEGRAFTSGGDTTESDTDNWERMGAGGAGAAGAGRHGVLGLLDQLASFPKPVICAVNGLALGIGAMMLGYADLVFMSVEARVQLPLTRLGLGPEGGASYTFPQLMGRQNAMWALLSSEWLSAEECARMGLAWRLCEADDLLPVALDHAERLADLSVAVLIETKRLITAPYREEIERARGREVDSVRRMMGGPASREGFMARLEGRQPDFRAVDAEYPDTTTVVVTERFSRLRPQPGPAGGTGDGRR